MSKLARRNADVDWNTFNAATYRQKYFDPISEEDWWVAQEALKFLSKTGQKISGFERIADIGTGPSLVLPLVSVIYARHIELVEPGADNVTYLESVLTNSKKMRNDWQTIEQKISEDPYASVEHQTARHLLSERAEVRPIRISDLKSNAYDMVTSCFCAESATANLEECAEMIQKVLGSLKKGHPYIVAYIEHSMGYPDQSLNSATGVVDMQKFPAVNIDESWLKERFKGTNIHIKRCSYVPELRTGYTGVLLATGTK